MALKKMGFIVRGDGFDPTTHVSVMSTPMFTVITVGVGTPEQGVYAARRLLEEGVQLIELCGAFGPVATARVIAAIDDRVPVGTVAYDSHSISRLHSLFAE
jgi:hypothetical protein